MIISQIVAVSKNYVIGKDNKLPWSLPADENYFHEVTFGHTIIMGRKNFEANGKALEGRTNIVLTRNKNYVAPGCIMTHTIKEAIEIASNQGEKEIFIVGGGEIYRQSLDYTSRIYITVIDTVIEGNVTYPKLNMNQWKVISKHEFKADKENLFNHVYYIYERV